jgi:predicted lipid-binding transport protein (Tim44 family)
MINGQARSLFSGGQARRPARPLPVARHRAHNRFMGRIIGTILGVVFAVWLIAMAAGGIFATFKTFLIIGLIALAVFVVVWLVARRPDRD